MVALTERENGHQPAVARAAAIGVRLRSDRVAERIDEKRHVLNRSHPCHATEEKSTESADPARVQETQSGRNQETNANGQWQIKPALPHHELVLSEVSDVVEWRLRIEFEKDPADMRVPETLRDIVWVIVVVHVLMVPAMIRNPRKSGILERGRSEDEGQETNRPLCLKGDVGEKSVIAERDAQSRCDTESQEKSELESIDAKLPEVKRYRSAGDCKGPDEKRTVGPIDPGGRNTKRHVKDLIYRRGQAMRQRILWKISR
jgi:hypothetical protein